MKILLVNRYHYPVGGTETYLFALDRMLREAGHQVRHFSAADPRNLPCGEAEFFARPLDPQKRPFDAARMLWNGEAARKLDALLARERPDVAHLNLVHHSLTLSILGPLARRKIPVVWTVHDLLPLCPNHLMLRAGKPCEDCLRGGYRACLLHRCVGGSVSKSLAGSFETWAARRLRLYDKVGCFIAPSECYRALLERAGFSRASVLHLPNPLPPGTAFDYTPPEGDYILYCGRLSEEKGLFPLLEAAKRLGAPLVVAGEGPLKSALEAAAARGGSRVTFRGRVEGEALRKLYRGAKCVAVPSLWREASGYAACEAMAMGRVVAASRAGGLAEHVADGETGFLVPPGDADALTKALSRALALPPAEYERMGRAAVKRAREMFSAGAVRGRLLAIYQTLCEGETP